MTPPILNNDNSLFRSGRVIHFGTPDRIRTSGLQSRSSQAVKVEGHCGARISVGLHNFFIIYRKHPEPLRRNGSELFANSRQMVVSRFHIPILGSISQTSNRHNIDTIRPAIGKVSGPGQDHEKGRRFHFFCVDLSTQGLQACRSALNRPFSS